jgi:hypothetical protein
LFCLLSVCFALFVLLVWGFGGETPIIALAITSESTPGEWKSGGCGNAREGVSVLF